MALGFCRLSGSADVLDAAPWLRDSVHSDTCPSTIIALLNCKLTHYRKFRKLTTSSQSGIPHRIPARRVERSYARNFTLPKVQRDDGSRTHSGPRSRGSMDCYLGVRSGQRKLFDKSESRRSEGSHSDTCVSLCGLRLR